MPETESNNQPKAVELAARFEFSLVVSASLSTTTKMSKQYAEGAAFFTRQAWEIEQRASSPTDMQRRMLEKHYLWYALAGISNAAFFLESAVHEFFMLTTVKTAADPPLTEAQVASLTEHWNKHLSQESKGRKQPVEDRYIAALKLAGREPIQKDREPTQSVRCLFEFRNALAHYAPVWEVGRPGEKPGKVERMLTERHFTLNPAHRGARFPNLYLSHGCAEWATVTALAFYGLFCSRMGIQNELEEPDVLLDTKG